jgi:hypothetical protein
MADTTNLLVNLFDGARQPWHADVNVLVQVFRPQPNKPPLVANAKGNSFPFNDLPYFNSPDDDLRVTISAKHYNEAGFFPVTMPKNGARTLNLMLVPKPHKFTFNRSGWDQLPANRPELFHLLRAGAADDDTAKARYEQLMKQHPLSLAALLNITTALDDIRLPRDSGTSALSYFQDIIWEAPDAPPSHPETPQQDRFYGHAKLDLVTQVVAAADQGDFAEEHLPGSVHPGATRSYKQVQFGEANVQITFLENAVSPPGLVKVETDIDYFQDPISHAILEFIPNHFTHGKTSPLMAYALRWMAAKAQPDLPEFDPLYVIERAAG